MASTDSHNALDLPKSGNTVRVRMVDTTAVMTLKAESFVEPVMKGHELLSIPDVAFLIENEKLGKKAMFDLGVRKDYWNLPPVLQKRLGTVIPSMRVDKDTTEILQEQKIDLNEINDVIWSHTHWDHSGSTYRFPPSTNLVYGSEVRSMLPAYPENVKSPLSAADFEDRKNVAITMDGKIGSLPAHDFYGDGSLYLLDTPGHSKGHVCALARTTPDTFLFLGGDLCHFVGDFRPSPAHPLPDPIPDGVLDPPNPAISYPSPCPASVFADQHPNASAGSPSTTPWYKLSTHRRSAYDDPVASNASLAALRIFDASPDVLVCIAHDPSLVKFLPTLNASPAEDLNEWKAKGYKQMCMWDWLNELPRDGVEARPKPIVEGFWRDGKVWDRAGKEMEEKGKTEERKAEQGKL